ncbi:MAG: hypothetical protein ACU85E_12560 [Gammaproteobacteria bacterium]
MVNSIRYWLRATHMLEINPDGLHATYMLRKSGKRFFRIKVGTLSGR